MSMMDPNMAAMYAPLASAAMMPQAAVASQGLAGPYADEKRRQGMVQTAAPRPGQTSQALQNHLMQQKVLLQGQSQPQQPAPAQVQTAPRQAGAPAPREQDFNPAGVTLGEQEGGGRNVELIRGGQSQVQHFNEQGDNTGTLPAAGVKSSPAAADAKGQPTWKDYMKQDQFMYDHVTKQSDRLDKIIEDKAKLGESDPALSQQRLLLHHQADQLGRKLGDPMAVQNYQSQTNPGVVQGVHTGGNAAEQEVAEASARIHQPVQDGPNQGFAPPANYTMTGAEHQPQIPAPPKPGSPISPQLLEQIYHSTGRDKDKTRQVAEQAGWTIPQAQAPDKNSPDHRNVFQKASDLATGILSAG